MPLSFRRPHRGPALAIIVIATLWSTPMAFAAQSGYCWNATVGWVNMSGVTFNDSSRTFAGTASYFGGTFDGATFGPGDIDFGAQGSLSVTLSTSTDSNGNWPMIGQAFSEQLGWIAANHGGSQPAAMKASGELTGNFWSNEFGWFSCSSSDVGASNVQIWTPGSATASSSPAGNQGFESGGSGPAGGRRGTGVLPVRRTTATGLINNATRPNNARVPSPRTGPLTIEERIAQRKAARIAFWARVAGRLEKRKSKLKFGN